MIRIIALGKIKDKHLKALIDDYILRIGRYHKIEVLELKDETITDNNSTANIIETEGKRVMEKLGESDYVVALDLHGKMMDSLEFARNIDHILTHNRNLTFVIGGSLGISKEITDRANLRLKLSDMTFFHQMTRLILTEQIYRAFKILNRETYHK